jgi:hypothetical protein
MRGHVREVKKPLRLKNDSGESLLEIPLRV